MAVNFAFIKVFIKAKKAVLKSYLIGLDCFMICYILRGSHIYVKWITGHVGSVNILWRLDFVIDFL